MQTKHKAAPPRADIITQRELQEILDRYNALGWDILEIRKRREAGAEVEPGKFAAESNPGDPITNYNRPVHGIGMFGLDIEEKGKPSDVYAEEVPAPTVQHNPPVKDKYAEQTALIASSLVMTGLDDLERAFLATCQKLYRGHMGCTTPFDEFFIDLVICVQIDRWPTPDDVQDELKRFRDNWDDMKFLAPHFLARYPETHEQEAN